MSTYHVNQSIDLSSCSAIDLVRNMLKKLILSALVAGFVGITGASAMYSATELQGNDIPYYYDYNTDFPVMYSRMGGGQFMDRTSAVITSQKGNIIEIAVNVFSAWGYPDPFNHRDNQTVEMGNIETKYYRYDTRSDSMFVRTEDGSYRYLPPDGIEAEVRGSIEAGEAAYYILTGQKFYGSERFSSDFYDRF